MILLNVLVFVMCVCADITSGCKPWSKTLDTTACCLPMNFRSTLTVHERRARARKNGRPGQCSLFTTLTEVFTLACAVLQSRCCSTCIIEIQSIESFPFSFFPLCHVFSCTYTSLTSFCFSGSKCDVTCFTR